MMSLWGTRGRREVEDGGGQGWFAEASKKQVKDTEGRSSSLRRERLGGEQKSKVLGYPGLLLCNHLLPASEEGIVGSGNLTQVPCKNNTCSVPLSYFSNPAVIFFPPVF